MTALLDTHFLLWLVVGATRLDEFPWLEGYRPWGVSPVSVLEVQFLAEVGRLEVSNPTFTEALIQDERFLLDDVPFLALTRSALSVGWTRDPFDRLLAAHSRVRRVPLCTLDRNMRANHATIVPELAI